VLTTVLTTVLKILFPLFIILFYHKKNVLATAGPARPCPATPRPAARRTPPPTPLLSHARDHLPVAAFKGDSKHERDPQMHVAAKRHFCK
jgi:hypothetical protein